MRPDLADEGGRECAQPIDRRQPMKAPQFIAKPMPKTSLLIGALVDIFFAAAHRFPQHAKSVK
jgi:hypothetical protein